MNCTQKEKYMFTDFLLGLLNSLPLPAHYKTDHLLDKLADLPATNLPATVEPVSFNAVNVQTISMPTTDILPWQPNDPILVYQNRECRVKRIQVNTSACTSDLYPEPVYNDEVFEDPIFTSNDIDIPNYDSPSKVNHLDVGTMNDYWSRDSEIITDNAVKINKDDPTAIRGQFDSGANTTVTNFLIYLHNYRPYANTYKCPVKLTGTVSTINIHPLGIVFLHLPAPTPCGFLAGQCFYSPRLSSSLNSPRDILKTWKD